MASLTLLYIDRNELTGPIPQSMGGLKKLQELSLFKNQISGSIPDSIANLTSLKILNLSQNRLSGAIPEGIGGLRSLRNLSLSANSLSYHIPVSLGNMSSLRFLRLDSNLLNGSIPSSFSHLSSLSILDLSNNSFSGPLPEITLFKNLSTCSIENNSGLCHNLDSFQIANDICSYSLTSECPMKDCEVLKSWINLDSNPCCLDPRVVCDKAERITELHLRNLNLSGSITSRIIQLDHLVKL